MISLAVAYYTASRPLRIHEGDVRTATQAKRLAGVASSAWTYVRLPRHEREAKCRCFYCKRKPRKGHIDVFARPPWVSESVEWTPQPWPWVITDIGKSNAHLNLPDESVVVLVDVHDMPQFATELCARGTAGMLHALAWVQSKDRLALRERME